MSEILKSGHLNKVGVPDRHRATIQPGGAVRLVAPHPCAGWQGRYQGVEYLPAPDRWACKVELDEGGCYVFNATQWEAIP